MHFTIMQSLFKGFNVPISNVGFFWNTSAILAKCLSNGMKPRSSVSPCLKITGLLIHHGLVFKACTFQVNQVWLPLTLVQITGAIREGNKSKTAAFIQIKSHPLILYVRMSMPSNMHGDIISYNKRHCYRLRTNSYLLQRRTEIMQLCQFCVLGLDMLSCEHMLIKFSGR